MELHPESVISKQNKDAYEYFVRDVFYPNEQDWQAFKNGIFAADDYDFKTFLEQYFKIKF